MTTYGSTMFAKSLGVRLVTNVLLGLLLSVELSCGQRFLWLYQLPVWQGPYQNDRLADNFGLVSRVRSDSGFIRPVYINLIPETRPVAPFHEPKYGNWQEPQEERNNQVDNQISTEIRDVPMKQTDNGNSEEIDSYRNTNGISYPLLDAITSPTVVVIHRCDSTGLTRFDRGTNSCHAIGTQGPCGRYMIFTAKDALYGECQCDQSSFERPLIQIGNQCHLLFTQEMCPQGYWLTLMTPSGDPACMPNPCMSMPNSVFFKGECVPLNGSSSQCKNPQVVIFPEGSIEPACGYPKAKRRLHRRQISSVRRFSCRKGQKRHATGRCVSTSRTIVFRHRP